MTKIEWTKNVWNPVTGCQKTSPGCENCYAERFAKRLQGMPQSAEKYKNGFTPTWHPNVYDKPKNNKKPTVYFVCSMGDLFHENIPREEITKIITEYILPVKQHYFIILTKRPEIMNWVIQPLLNLDWSHVCIGVSVENPDMTMRIPWFDHILPFNGTKMVSIEPQLERISPKVLGIYHVDWVINGAETGPRKRFFDTQWAQEIQSYCVDNQISYFFKKDHKGEYPDGMLRQFPKKLQNFLDNLG